MDFSVGKAIREINKNGLKPAYFLKGDDSYLQNFFSTYLKNKFDNNLSIKYIDLNEQIDQEIFFNDLNSPSLFSSKNIFSIRNFSRVITEDKKNIINYLKNPNNDTILLFVLDDYLVKNKFSKEIYDNCVKIDTSTPFFSNKIKDWAVYYMKKNNIKLDDYILDDLVDSYGDNISNVINEIEKLYLITKNRDVSIDDYKSNYKNRSLKIWNLMNSLGMKDLDKSIYIFNSLLNNGFTLVPIVASLFDFYLSLLNSFSSDTSPKNMLNKTIKSKITLFKQNFSAEEVSNIITELRNIDILVKSSSLSAKLLFDPFIVKVCKGYYGKK